MSGSWLSKERFAGLIHAPVRFPLALACATGWAGVTIAQNHIGSELDWVLAQQIRVYLLLGFFASLAATLFSEGREWPAWRRLLLSAAALGLTVLLAFMGPEERNPFGSPAFLFMAPGLVMLMIVAPFLRRGAQDYAIWEFNYGCWTSAAFGVAVALVIALGGTAVLGALEILIGLDIGDRYYGDLWTISMGVLWPWQTLAGVPGGGKETKRDQTPRWANYVISWLLMPLAVIYLALLYIFAAKIAVQWALPDGQVGWLVGGFVGYGLAVWHAAYPLRKTGNRLVKAYLRFFHTALFVPVLLLAAGVGARVLEYGITEKRYGLIVITVWLAGIATYGVWKRAPGLNIAPVSFAILMILAAFGPWGASAVSIRNQLGHLEVMLTEAGILAEGRIRPGEGVANPQEVARINDTVDYLRAKVSKDALHGWLREAGITVKEDSRNGDILAAMGLVYDPAWKKSGSFSFSATNSRTVDVAGFDVYHEIEIVGKTRETSTTVTAPSTGTRYAISFEYPVLVVASEQRPEERVTFNLTDLAETMRARQLETGQNDSRELMTLEERNGALRVRFYVHYLSGEWTGGIRQVTFGRGLLLIGHAA